MTKRASEPPSDDQDADIARLVASYGVDPARWPAERAHMGDAPPDRAALARAFADDAALDAMLDELPMIEASDAFVERVAARAPSGGGGERRSIWRALADLLAPDAGPRAAGGVAIAGLVLGLIIGAGGDLSGATALMSADGSLDALPDAFEIGFAADFLAANETQEP